MTLDLSQPLAWTQAVAAADDGLALLSDLQGNILKGHGRHVTANIFLTFDDGQRASARTFMRALAEEVTCALDQLMAAQIFKATGKKGTPFFSVLLSAGGYRALGFEDKMPLGEAFAAGMQSRDLDDPSPADWEADLRGALHAMVLIGANDKDELSELESLFQQRVGGTGGAVRIVAIERGDALFNDDGNGIEHFGYVDGRSQPLALVEDLQHEDEVGGRDQWDPEIPLSQLLVKCPAGTHAASFGSYFVFRKLEQNVREFKRREIDLAELMPPKEKERAGASVVGRFERGTPVTLSPSDLPLVTQGSTKLIPNNFNFANDQSGLKCPFASHIRKTNPRDDTDDSKDHLMARRGIPYGKRTDRIEDTNLDAKPTGGVGLLFMAYQSSLEDQFEFTQILWANNARFRHAGTGIDPIIGQGGQLAAQRYPKEYGASLTEPFDFSGFVTMKGGEYFFAPSISGLKQLA